MNNAKPAGLKWTKQTLTLALTVAALMVSYLLLLYLNNRHFGFGAFLMGLPSALGILAAWLTIKKFRIDRSPILKKYHLHPDTLAFGLGGPLAGLISLGILCREDYCLGRCNCESILFGLFLMVFAGQALWLIWPLALLNAIGRNRPRLVEKSGWIQDIITLFGAAALFPGAIILAFPAVWLLSDIFC